MALSQHPASRFFAAFYRWNQCTHQTHRCLVQSPHSLRGGRTPARTLTRPYHAIRSLRQQERSAWTREDATDNNTTDATREPPPAPVIKQPREGQDARSDDEVDNVNVEIYTDKLRDNVRRLMRQVPSSVAVVTVASLDPELKQHVPMGVAVSSLSTVTLDPPTISFNIKHPSKTLDAIKASNGRFRVHFPAADRSGAVMVDSFCRGNHKDAYDERKRNLKMLIPGHHTASRAPQITGNSVRAAMECTITQELEVADHVILVARIDDMESHDAKGRTIVYVDGMYIRSDGGKVTMSSKSDEVSDDGWSVWDYPISLGDAERHDYMERVKKIAKATPGVSLEQESLRTIESGLPLPPGALGINLERIVIDSVVSSGQKTRIPPHLQISSSLHDFWGRLSPSDRTKINERAKNLVTENRTFLTLKYRVFLQYLGVSSASKDFLPSDIATPLRAAGLLGPFERQARAPARNLNEYTLEYLEHVEYRLVNDLTEMGFDQAKRARLEKLITNMRENRHVAGHFNKARGRLFTIAFPDQYTPDKIDIAGHVSPEEARVVASRIINFLKADNPAVFRRALNFDYRECLRLIRVDPTITGFNVEFFFGKIGHIQETTRDFHDVAGRLQDMLNPWFADTVTWDELEKRVKDFVQKSPLRAMAWSNRDKLAAMGLAWETTLTVPVTSNNQPLNSGHILDTLVAKELKSMHNLPSVTTDLRSAIARFLKEQYNFDVDPANPVQVDPNVRSSSDEMQQARVANRNVDVMRNMNAQEEEEDVVLASVGPRIRGIQDSKNANKHVSNKGLPEEDGARERAGPGKGKERTWKEYSLVSGRKFG